MVSQRRRSTGGGITWSIRSMARSIGAWRAIWRRALHSKGLRLAEAIIGMLARFFSGGAAEATGGAHGQNQRDNSCGCRRSVHDATALHER
jgi:hypothetical protein